MIKDITTEDRAKRGTAYVGPVIANGPPVAVPSVPLWKPKSCPPMPDDGGGFVSNRPFAGVLAARFPVHDSESFIVVVDVTEQEKPVP